MNRIISFFKQHYIFICILFLAVLLRSYKLDILTTFGGDQGIDFLVMRDMVLYHKWTLIGIKTSISSFYQGPVYLYILFPFFVIFNLNPIAGPIAAISISIITIILLYLTANKYFSQNIAVLSTALFAVSPEFIMYGNTPLYQHFLPLFIVLTLFLFLSTSNKLRKYILLGLSVGVGVELHLLNITLAPALLVYLLIFSENKIRNSVGFIAGIILGILPTIIFELRHQFLNINQFLNFEQAQNNSFSLLNIFQQWVSGASIFLGGYNFVLGTFLLLIIILFLLFKKQKNTYIAKFRILSILNLIFITLLSLKFSAFAPHYILPFWVISLLLLPLLLEQIVGKPAGIAIMILIIIFNLFYSINRLGIDHGYTMPDGLTMKKIQIAGEIIAADSRSHHNFNVASILDGNTRNYPLRYAVLINNSKPADVDQYPYNDYLYVTAGSKQQELTNSKTWEVTSFFPSRIGKKWNLGDNIFLYRIERIKK